MKNDDGGPAFPCKGDPVMYGDPDADKPFKKIPGSEENLPGMSVRQWYKGMAIQGMASRLDPSTVRMMHDGTLIASVLAKAAAVIADAAIEEDNNK